MDNDKYKTITDALYILNGNLHELNRVMSTLLILAFDSSTFKSKTNDEIKKVMPKINETLKAINESINDWIIFYNWLLINCFNRSLFNES